jgi:hypothetical protein
MQRLARISDWFIERCTDFLSSTVGFYIAFIVPLAVIVLPKSIKEVENILSSNWLQLWALFGMSIISANGARHAKQAHELGKQNHAAIDKMHKHLGIDQ